MLMQNWRGKIYLVALFFPTSGQNLILQTETASLQLEGDVVVDVFKKKPPAEVAKLGRKSQPVPSPHSSRSEAWSGSSCAGFEGRRDPQSINSGCTCFSLLQLLSNPDWVSAFSKRSSSISGSSSEVEAKKEQDLDLRIWVRLRHDGVKVENVWVASEKSCCGKVGRVKKVRGSAKAVAPRPGPSLVKQNRRMDGRVDCWLSKDKSRMLTLRTGSRVPDPRASGFFAIGSNIFNTYIFYIFLHLKLTWVIFNWIYNEPFYSTKIITFSSSLNKKKEKKNILPSDYLYILFYLFIHFCKQVFQ